jgi:serine/threonine protein kinase
MVSSGIAVPWVVLLIVLQLAAAFRMQISRASNAKNEETSYSVMRSASEASFVPSRGQRSHHQKDSKQSRRASLEPNLAKIGSSGDLVLSEDVVLSDGRLPNVVEKDLPISLGIHVTSDFGEVQHRESSNNYAMRRLSSEVLMEDVEREISMQRLVESDHIVKVYETLRAKNGDIIIMTELLPDGRLSDKIRAGGGLNQNMDVRDTLRQIVDGVKFLHDRGVAHLDLKPQNIWCKGKDVKIGDFAYAIIGQSHRVYPHPRPQSPAYLAPEILRYVNSSAKAAELLDLHAVDVWALGVTFYEVLTNRLPQRPLVVPSVGDLLKRAKEEGIVHVYAPSGPLSKTADRDANDLIEHMLQIDASKRYTIAQVASHRYFKSASRSEA